MRQHSVQCIVSNETYDLMNLNDTTFGWIIRMQINGSYTQPIQICWPLMESVYKSNNINKNISNVKVSSSKWIMIRIP